MIEKIMRNRKKETLDILLKHPRFWTGNYFVVVLFFLWFVFGGDEKTTLFLKIQYSRRFLLRRRHWLTREMKKRKTPNLTRKWFLPSILGSFRLVPTNPKLSFQQLRHSQISDPLGQPLS